MKSSRSLRLAIVLLLGSTSGATARPRPVLPPWPEQGVLARWGFDELIYRGTNLSSAQLAAAHRAEGWSGYALTRTGESAPPLWLPAVDAAGHTNLALGAGALRMWFRPDGSSGEGLSWGGFPRLLELARVTSAGLEVLWSLHLDGDGSTLYLSRVAGGSAEDLLSAPVAWQAGEWHLVALVWSPTGTALYLDSELAAQGRGVSLPAGWLPASVAMALGSDLAGGNLAQGQFEEVASLRSYDPQRQATYYAGRSSRAALGPITPEEDAARAAQRKLLQAAAASSALAAGGGASGMMGFDSGNPCPTNGPVRMTNLWCGFATNTGWTMQFDVVGGTNSILCDVFTAEALAGTNVAQAQWLQVTNTFTCETVFLTNQLANASFYILGLTNDTDAGGLSDAFEQLVTGGDIHNPADDLDKPLIRLQVTDSVALEQQPTNTARFLLTRLGGFLKQPLTVPLLVSGSASNNGDYTLSSATTTATNLLVTFPAWQSSVEIILTPQDDSVAEGTETATLTLTTNTALWEVDLARRSATAWILEEYSRIYTLTNDFKLGVMAGLEAVEPTPNGQLQFKTNLPLQFPFINVACSGRGTVARINTTNGLVVGEYRTAPGRTNVGYNDAPSPSRTTVDQFGNAWVANREDQISIRGTDHGSVTRIGLIIGGTRFEKNGTNYTANPLGQYVALSNATYNTCLDRDGDGYIRTSRGLADILPWTNEDDADSYGGVSTAEDEAITEYVRVPCTGTRTVAVDKFNDIWVGGFTGDRTHLKVNGLTAMIVPDSAFHPSAGGYGGVMDALGHLWSSGALSSSVLWLRPPSTFPPQASDWAALSQRNGYGIAVDPLHPYIWQTTGGYLFRWHTNGTPVTDGSGGLPLYPHGGNNSQGLTVGEDGHVWVAHGGLATTVGHVNTNGTHIGNVQMQLTGLRGEYFANTNLSGTPALVRTDSELNFDWGDGSPGPAVPTNDFSARWAGVLEARTEGEHILTVTVDAGAACLLKLNGNTVLDNWTTPTNATTFSVTNFLYTNTTTTVLLQYADFTGAASVTFSWTEPGAGSPEPIPAAQFRQTGSHPTGVSVDAAGKIWAANLESHNAMRIDPNGGEVVERDGVTNHIGLVDLVVDLGDGTFHTGQYAGVAAAPYNYSDMTGFNNHIVNPGGQPLKGHWTVVDDSGMAGGFWHAVSWSNYLPAGCSMEVHVRASDDRVMLAREAFLAVSNNVPFTGVNGRYIEVRAALTRTNASQQPVLYDLTLHGLSTVWAEAGYVDYSWPVHEGDDVEFWPVVDVPGPLGYQWYALYPWANDFVLLDGETNSTLVSTNVDSFDDEGWFGVLVTTATGESLFLDPVQLEVDPVEIIIPPSGAASRYPAEIVVFGQTTNFTRVEVILKYLDHQRSEDLDILLVSPSGHQIMLMSDAGGTNAVEDATLAFHPWPYMASGYPPSTNAIPSNGSSDYWPANYGENEAQLPSAPLGPYLDSLEYLPGSSPNGTWRLYIYDDHTSAGGWLHDSWRIKFYYE